MLDEKVKCLFFTDTYKVLSIINQQCYQVGESYASITQKEIANELGFNVMKANEIMKKLTETGYIEAVPKHKGRYIVTEKAKKLIKRIEK